MALKKQFLFLIVLISAIRKTFILVIASLQLNSQVSFCDSVVKQSSINSFDTLKLKKYTVELQKSIQENCNIAICLSKEAIKQSEKLGNVDLSLQFYALLGYAYKTKGDFDLSISTFISGLKLAEIKGYTTRAAFMANNLGTAFLEARKYKEAQMYFLVAVKNGKQRGDKLQLARTYANYGYLKEEQNQHDSALYYYAIAKPEFEKIKDSIRLADLLLNIGRSEMSLKRIKSSITNYQQALLIYKNFQDLDGECRTHLNLAEAFALNNQIDLAIIENEKALILAKQLESDYLMDFCYAALSDNFMIQGNYKKSLENFKLHDKINDSLNSADANIRIAKLQEQYQGEKKDREIKTQASIISNQEREKKNLFFGLFISVLVCGIILILGLMLRNKNIKLNDLISEKEFLLNEVHHRVKNNLQLLSSIIELQMRNNNNQELLNTLQDNQSRILTIANLHDKLYKQESVQYIEIDVYLKTLADDICKSFPSNELKVNYNIESLKLHVDKTILISLLLNEILTNAIKHAFKKQSNPIINISLSSSMNKIILVISDNGEGIKDEIDLLGTKSLGFKLIKSLAKQLKSNLVVENNFGLTFKFEMEK